MSSMVTMPITGHGSSVMVTASFGMAAAALPADD
jgi:hypothetical protein